MNIWRLISHHEDPVEYAEWIVNRGVIAIGWGGTGDLSSDSISFSTAAELRRHVEGAHFGSAVSNWVNGGNSLWRLCREVKKGDLVIISARGSRKSTVRITGDYYYVNNGDDSSHTYEHRRKVEVVPINPNILWQATGGIAPGEGKRSTLVRCARALTDAEANALMD